MTIHDRHEHRARQVTRSSLVDRSTSVEQSEYGLRLAFTHGMVQRSQASLSVDQIGVTVAVFVTGLIVGAYRDFTQVRIGKRFVTTLIGTGVRRIATCGIRRTNGGLHLGWSRLPRSARVHVASAGGQYFVSNGASCAVFRRDRWCVDV